MVVIPLLAYSVKEMIVHLDEMHDPLMPQHRLVNDLANSVRNCVQNSADNICSTHLGGCSGPEQRLAYQ